MTPRQKKVEHTVVHTIVTSDYSLQLQFRTGTLKLR